MVEMSPADDARWRAVQRWKAERLAPAGGGPSWWHQIVAAAGTVLEQVPGAARVGRAAVDGLGWLIDRGAGTVAASVSRDDVVEDHRARGHRVERLADVRELPLDQVHAVMPQLGTRYTAAGVVQGVGSSVLTSSGTVLTVLGGAGSAGVAVAPGLGAVVTTMALDAAVGVLLSSRAVAHVAAHHGYDVTDPQERLFALGVLSLGLAEDGRRAAAYRELTGIAQGLARREAWRLTSAQAGAVVRAVSTQLALRLTQDRVAQLVPVLGTVVGVRRNVRGLTQVLDDAEHLYAERLLRERYGLPLGDVRPDERGEIADAVEHALADTSSA